jgi:probable phosphoglycerate mutase
MRLIFVRHGEPNYELDCLTATGQAQAEAASARLAREGISKIYASTCGRALETAAPTAARLGLDVERLDFMREITWGGAGLPHDGHPWTLSDALLEAGFDFRKQDWPR